MKKLFPSLPEDASLGSLFQMFGEKLAPWCQYESLVMRGESELSAAERELIAAYVSGLNACSYCHDAHTIFAHAYGIEPSVIEALIDDPDSAQVDHRMKPVLAYVAKLTLSPSRMTEADAQAVYDAGWSERALFDAIQVCGVFNLVNRLIEGTGIANVARGPATLDEQAVEKFTSNSFYTDFGRSNGLDVK
ncbi:MAG: peroxidase-related enzyme [Rhodobacteraceae bacterium]|nr:peroxidase-related enzyme [Paracoccaceae bacterium]